MAMLPITTELQKQLARLRDDHDLGGVKAEFEAEGSSFRDLVRLRQLTTAEGVGLFVKIGGVEAVRDIKDALELGVDGLIAPMVESPFGAKKFIDATRKIYGDCPVHTSLNLETCAAFECMDEILGIATGIIDNITVGRSDLSGSYFDDKVTPDSDFILDLIESAMPRIHAAGLTVTVGGSVSRRTLDALRNRPALRDGLERLETRKVILTPEAFLADESAIDEAFTFEKLYILSKKEYADRFLEAEVGRLTQLKARS